MGRPCATKNRLGTVRILENGTKIEVIEYKNANDIVVRINDEYNKHTKWAHFLSWKGISTNTFISDEYKFTDHLGNTYSSEKDLCSFYGINPTTYRNRIMQGWSQKDALTTPNTISNEYKEQDHLGNFYSSKQAMCDFYNINISTFDNRIKSGWTLEEALTTPTNEKLASYECTDHNGRKFKNKKDMCAFYQISENVFYLRIKLGWTLEKALTTPNYPDSLYALTPGSKGTRKCHDHLNQIFNSVTDMCDYYHVPYPLFKNRTLAGWTLEEALTGNKVFKRVQDHQGNFFATREEMCSRYGISLTAYKDRLSKGWTLEQTLTTPIKINLGTFDHLGNHYLSKKEMCHDYKIGWSCFKGRIANGWTLEEALTIPKCMYIGEYRVAECLKRLNVKFYHDCSIKTIFKDLGIKVDWDEFLDGLQARLGLAGINWSKSKIERLRPDFTLYTDDDNKIRGIIEFDGRQHQNFVEFFFKTIEEFLRRSNADFVKQDFFEYMGIPMLRIRDDQVNMIDEMVEDFVTHPESYIHGHNTFLSEEEYWSILADQKAKIEAAFAA